MKNLILLLLPIVMLLLVSCGTNPQKADPNKEQEKTEAVTTKTSEVTYVITGGVDMLSLFILTAVYTDASGKKATESITTFPWVKTISVTTPFNAILDVEKIPIVDYAVKEKYGVEIHTAISFSGFQSYDTGKSTIGADKVKDYQKKFVERNFKKEETIK
ncbi:hypothetical protein [Bacteroides sp. UBA939]|uniref:hypothetical protein n=1 Tax=Bacteroides sp. UBA939 TaxID=1946092 RepID=UPI0025C72FA3|nr:hypothetical protein [Bacteroides sp. UBA939]